MTPKHKEIVRRVRSEFQWSPSKIYLRDAADAIEALDGQLEILTALVGIVKKESAEWQARVEALLTELRAKETEIETLAAKVERAYEKGTEEGFVAGKAQAIQQK